MVWREEPGFYGHLIAFQLERTAVVLSLRGRARPFQLPGRHAWEKSLGSAS